MVLGADVAGAVESVGEGATGFSPGDEVFGQLEFANHVRGAVTNGLTPNDLRAVLVQVAIYCGIPIGADCFQVAATTLSDSKAK